MPYTRAHAHCSSSRSSPTGSIRGWVCKSLQKQPFPSIVFYVTAYSIPGPPELHSPGPGDALPTGMTSPGNDSGQARAVERLTGTPAGALYSSEDNTLSLWGHRAEPLTFWQLGSNPGQRVWWALVASSLAPSFFSHNETAPWVMAVREERSTG